MAGGCVRSDPSHIRQGVCGKGTSSSVLYDPVEGRAVRTGSMLHERAGASATRLHDGRVLVMGGEVGILSGINEYAFTAEVYDPKAGKWTRAGSARESQGLPLSAFGGQFAKEARAGPMVPLVSFAHLFGHTATLLPRGPRSECGRACGQVLVVGRGRADLYDPVTGRWRLLVQEHGITHRYSRTATLLKNGQILLVGTGPDGTDLFDPATSTFKPVQHLTVPRVLQTASLLPSGQVLVAGGFRGSDVTKPTNSVEVYRPSPTRGSAAELGPDRPWRPAPGMLHARFGHTATHLPGGKVLVVGGSDRPDGNLVSAEIYDPRTERWAPAGRISTPRRTPFLGLALTGIQPSASGATSFSSTLLDDGRVVVLGGGSKSADVYVPAGYTPRAQKTRTQVLPIAIGAGALIVIAGVVWARRRKRSRGTLGPL